MERIIKGLVNQKSEIFDRYVSSELTNNLFPKREFPDRKKFGGDLIAR